MKQNWIKALGKGVRKRAPALLMGAGIAGMVTTTVLAVRATPKALRLLEQQKAETPEEDLSPTEVVKTVWKCYIPAAVTGAISIACLIESHKIHGRRNAALATLYSLSESALREYQEKVIETVGPKKEEHIRDEIDKDKVQAIIVDDRMVVNTGHGTTLCLDSITNTPFWSDINYLKKVMNDLNHQMVSTFDVSLNEFYMELGLDPIDPNVGDLIGWNTTKMIDLEFSSQLTRDGRPCLVMRHGQPPFYEFQYV